MGKITFILGGARSGKSNHAIELAKKNGKKIAFIATGIPFDNEMKKRIKIHKQNRPSDWYTFEEPKNITKALKKIKPNIDLIIIDCLTLLVSNLLLLKNDSSTIEKNILEMLKTLKAAKYKSIIVANEVGLGIVPNTNLGRDFRDIAGKVNQLTALKANQVIFMVSGIPSIIK